MRSKIQIGLGIVLIAASPFILLYFEKFVHWLRCGNSADYGRPIVGSCGGLDFFSYGVYGIGLAFLFALVGCLLIYFTTLDDKK